MDAPFFSAHSTEVGTGRNRLLQRCLFMATERSNGLMASIHRLAQRGCKGNPTDGELLHRFIAHRDELAVSTLVQRYGPLVLGVCPAQSIAIAEDAEDAFQATFLVLFHKARSIADPELLANWLYGVAYYTAKNAKIGATRRTAREREVAQMSQGEPVARDKDSWELKSILDEELSRFRAIPLHHRFVRLKASAGRMSHADLAVSKERSPAGWPVAARGCVSALRNEAYPCLPVLWPWLYRTRLLPARWQLHC